MARRVELKGGDECLTYSGKKTHIFKGDRTYCGQKIDTYNTELLLLAKNKGIESPHRCKKCEHWYNYHSQMRELYG